MGRNLWLAWIVFLCIFSSKFIKNNYYFRLSHQSCFPHSFRTCTIRQEMIPSGICTLESNLVDLFNESLKPLCLTPEHLLGFQYCFNFLQALFVILEFYFLFDQFFGSFAFLLTQSSSSPSLWPQLYKLIHYSFTQFILHYSDHYLLFP